REAGVRRQPGLGDRTACRAGEALVGDERGRARVLDDVADLRPREVPVDRRDIQPDLERRVVHLQELEPVRREDHDAVTGCESAPLEPNAGPGRCELTGATYSPISSAA